MPVGGGSIGSIGSIGPWRATDSPLAALHVLECNLLGIYTLDVTIVCWQDGWHRQHP
jgi:hypothetical protein